MAHLIDLSHTFNSQTPVYPGDPIPECTQLTTVQKEGWVDFQIKTGLHVGTHVDAPMHMIEGGKPLSKLPLESFYGNGRLLDVRNTSKIGVDLLHNLSLQKGDVLILFTGFSEYFVTPKKYYEEAYREIEEAFAERLVEIGISMIGMDMPSPDRPPFPIHKILLGADIPILENLTNLDQLVHKTEFKISAFPPKFELDAAPVRVVAHIH